MFEGFGIIFFLINLEYATMYENNTCLHDDESPHMKRELSRRVKNGYVRNVTHS